MSEIKKYGKHFTDRESGTYAGLMLTLRKYRDRLEVRHGYELNKKPREIDCLIIDKKAGTGILDNDIARMFKAHNIVEFKNPSETLNVNTVWKVISYATQYKSETDVPIEELTITMIRASKPKKAIKMLTDGGYKVENPNPGIYMISGMVDILTQIVVTSELRGDDYVPLRIQRRGANREDCVSFARNIKNLYSESEMDYVGTVVRNGMYDDAFVLFAEAKEDRVMYEKLMEFFKDELEAAENKGRAEGEAKGRAEGEAKGRAEREGLLKQIQALQNELMSLKAAMS